MNTYVICFIIFWVGCGILDYGISVAYLQKGYATIAYKYRYKDRVYCFCMAILGPFSLFGTFITGQYGHGWML